MRVACFCISAAFVVVGCGSDGGAPPTGNTDTGVIAGTVIDVDSSNGGVRAVSIQLVGPGGPETITTSASGAFSVSDADPGAWQANLQVPAAYDLAAGEAGSRSATVTAGQTATLTPFRLVRPKGSLTGTATAAGAGVAGGTVEAERTGFTTRMATPAADGYSIGDLAVGSWTLEYTPPATHQLVTGESGSRSVTITEGGNATVSAFELEPAPPQSQLVEIHLSGTSFLNGTVTIAPGTTVRWINDGGEHTVTPENASQPGGWQRQTTSAPGVVFEHTFNVAGQTYRYRCEPHSADFTNGMVGAITVTQ